MIKASDYSADEVGFMKYIKDHELFNVYDWYDYEAFIDECNQAKNEIRRKEANLQVRKELMSKKIRDWG